MRAQVILLQLKELVAALEDGLMEIPDMEERLAWIYVVADLCATAFWELDQYLTGSTEHRDQEQDAILFMEVALNGFAWLPLSFADYRMNVCLRSLDPNNFVLLGGEQTSDREVKYKWAKINTPDVQPSIFGLNLPHESTTPETLE